MSLLTGLISTTLIPLLEHELVAHEPELLTLVESEIEALIQRLEAHIESKTGAPSGQA
jgi:hypothetical protein